MSEPACSESDHPRPVEVERPRLAEVAVLAPLRTTFDYLVPAHAAGLRPGQRVCVPFGRVRRTGVVLALKSDTDVAHERLKPLYSVLDEEPVLDASLLELLKFMSRYFHHPPGDVAATLLPAPLRRPRPLPRPTRTVVGMSDAGRRALQRREPALLRAPRRLELLQRLEQQSEPLAVDALDGGGKRWGRVIAQARDRGLVCVEAQAVSALEPSADSPSMAPERGPATEIVHELNAAQRAAVDGVRASDGFKVHLLQGVTGSGKTEVYLSLAEHYVALGRQVLVLVPEIGLTPQLCARFQARLGSALVSIHSGLSDGQRLAAWQSAVNGSARVVLGTRSALFTPLPALGFIVIDEEHDLSFKQQDGLRYSARDLGVFRARQMGIPIVLGSATPSLESLHNVARGRYGLLRLAERAGEAVAPSVELLDLRGRNLREGLCEPLIDALERTIEAGEQSILFVNRRGFANVLLCRRCAAPLECPRCDARLVYHRFDHKLRCHHCALERPMLDTCPQCQGPLLALGQGTQRVVEYLHERFPTARIERFDRDSVGRVGALDALLTRMRGAEIDVLVGTQMVAKGHDFPSVTLSAVVDADAGLFSTDFRALERMGQLLVQVAGRAGRARRPGRVIIQTHHPQHEMLQLLLREGYDSLARTVLAEREMLGLPPFSHQAMVRASAPRAADAEQLLGSLAATARRALAVIEPSTSASRGRGQLRAETGAAPLSVLGPVPAPLARRADRYHFQLLLEATERRVLHGVLDELVRSLEARSLPRGVRWSLDIDPQETG